MILLLLRFILIFILLIFLATFILRFLSPLTIILTFTLLVLSFEWRWVSQILLPMGIVTNYSIMRTSSFDKSITYLSLIIFIAVKLHFLLTMSVVALLTFFAFPFQVVKTKSSFKESISRYIMFIHRHSEINNLFS